MVVTSDNFNDQNEILVIVHSESCPDCKLAISTLKFLPKDVKTAFLSFDTEIDLCDHVLRIQTVPCYLYMKNGNVHSKMMGLQEPKTVNAFAVANRNNLI